MSAVEAVLLAGGSLLIMAMMITAMIRMNRAQHRRIQRRREAWRAAGGTDAEPDDYIGSGTYMSGNFG